MRTRPIGTPLTEQEAATVARFESAPDAEESLRERVARAIWLTHGRASHHWDDGVPDCIDRDGYRRFADAAISVMRGDDA